MSRHVPRQENVVHRILTQRGIAKRHQGATREDINLIAKAVQQADSAILCNLLPVPASLQNLYQQIGTTAAQQLLSALDHLELVTLDINLYETNRMNSRKNGIERGTLYVNCVAAEFLIGIRLKRSAGVNIFPPPSSECKT